MKPELLIAFTLPPQAQGAYQEDYTVHYAPDAEAFEWVAESTGNRIQAVLTTGGAGFSERQMQALPALGIIAVLGVGYENVDVAAARRRGIAVAHGENVNGDTTADHAMALLLSAARAIAKKDREIRAGRWRTTMAGSVTGRRLGILGLGDIGQRVARRAEGFQMPISYYNRHPRPDVPYRYAASAEELAREADFLVATCPGGDSTFHLIDAPVLEALGPEGILVNASRGSVVDTQALIEALQNRRILAAALDVVEDEPAIPEAFRSLDNLTVTPHIGGASPASVGAMTQAALDNLAAHFAGRPLPSPVPGSTSGD
jgi:lactate dehydrogenase-like 2-hydroxyacid dehydrogenase